ncbi:carboxylesterase family protein [Mucilaginibacter sp. PAMB04168]|uniref:carboxylesterase/lipase family protein n=1 Tax=Mucilaginibacter sp. PAMB04168 TaxID=3138567 RepID=UPI0031F664D2
MRVLNILFLTFFVISVHAQTATTGSLQIKTANGVLQGVTEASGIRAFKGVPFAQPPVGNLRWAAPQSPKNWEGVRKADHFGPQAMQRAIYSDMIFRSDGRSEDCLYLNVWTPAKSAKERLPVMVYFYGGGFIAGDGSEGRYDGESMATKGIVAITVNYRLGVFGFMAHPELTKESPNHSSGNYGLMDQHAALLWVQKNIAAFGGDPKKVTIAGESAGSMSVSGQMASPLSKGLFAGAIAESGSLMGNLSPVPLADAEQVGVKFATQVGVSSLAHLRNMPADKLLELSAATRFPTTVDGYFLPKTPSEIFNAGQQMKVPLLAGWNSAESGYRAILGKDSVTVNAYQLAVQKLYAENAAAVLKAYAAKDGAEVEQAATDLASDRFIAFASWKLTDLHSKTGGKPVYRYYYTRKRGDPAKSPGAVHSAEIEYALGNLRYNKAYNWTPDDFKVSETLQNYFVNFIKTGNPNGKGLPAWNTLQSTTPRQVMIIDVESRAQGEKYPERYLLLDKLSTSK